MGAWGRLRAVWARGASPAWRAQKGPLHSDVFRQLNTLQLHAPLDRKERDRLQALQARNHADGRNKDQCATRVRHLLNVVIGVGVGLVAVTMRLSYQFISDWRTQVVLNLLGEADGWGSASRVALIAALITASLALVASVLVAWQPPAASSGIPGVIAYLNGVDLNHALGPRVLAAKILGTILAVGSGLAVGPEGPMIHVGAMVGRFAVHGLLRPILRLGGEQAGHLQEELERQPLRYDVQAAAMGAGAGIAAAFSAPLAGTLFVVEEAASFFSKRLFLHTFITCACALATTMGLDFLTKADPHSFYARTPQCDFLVAWSPLLILQIAFIGVLCGLLGWAFNRFVVVICRACARQAYSLGQCWKLRCQRFAVVLLIGMLSGASTVVFVYARPCEDASLQHIFESSSGCIPEEWMYQITDGAVSVKPNQVDFGFRGKSPGPRILGYIPSPGLFGAQFNPHLCPEALRRMGDRCRIPGIEHHLRNSSGLRAEHYCCGFADMSALERGAIFDFQRPNAPLNMSRGSWPQAACVEVRRDKENSVFIEHYSPAAALTFTKPAAVVRNLLVRGAPHVLPSTDLMIFLGGYGLFTVLSTGLWVPGGLLVPMMIIGATTGRLCGLLWDWCLSGPAKERRRPPVPWIPEVGPLLELLYPNAKEPYPGLPPEPGVLALAGCAAFLSGSGALALFVIVLLVEITLEPFLIPVVIIAVLAARGTASLLHSKGLYHELMEVQSLPFLSEHHHWRQEHYVVTDVLREDLATWHRRRGAESEITSEAERGEAEQQDWSLFEAPPEAANFAASVTTEPRGGVLQSGRSSEEDLSGLRALVVTVRVEASCEEVFQLLDENPMVSGFPVVGEEGRLLGLATRASLAALVERKAASGGSMISSLANGRASGAGEPLAAAAARTCERAEVSGRPAGVEGVMDCAPFVVPANTHLKHAHMLFYQCGLRHVVVVDLYCRPLGLLTRKSLMPWRVPPANESHADTFVDSRHAHTPIHTPPSSPHLERRSVSQRSA